MKVLDPRFRLVSLADDLAFLLSGRDWIFLRGRLVCAVARSLPHAGTFQELAGCLAGTYDPLEVQYGLSLLDDRGCLVPRPVNEERLLPSADEIPWSRSAHAGPSPILVVADHYLRPAFRESIKAHIEAGRDVLPAKLRGGEVWIGPVLQAGGSPCW